MPPVGSRHWKPTSTAVPDEAVFDPATVERIRETLRQLPPATDGMARTRWRLADMLEVLDWLSPRSPSGLHRLLRRHRIRLRMGRPQLFSPDPAYAQKLERVLAVLRRVAADPDHLVLLFVDECSYHHWPETGRTWASLDDPAPRAARAAPGERHKKVIGGMNGRTGQVTYHQRARMTGEQIAAFLELVRAAYPDATTIFVVLDNAPVHYSEPVTRAAAQHRIELVYLPTYAPWLNPIEKLWAWLREAVLRLHRLAGQWSEVPKAVAAFLDHFAQGSDELLRRVGLLGDGMLATALRHAPT
jgi:hypothetical protein